MFSRLKRQAKPAEPDITRPDDHSRPTGALELEQTLNKILDTLNAVTRLLGRHAFDTSERSAAEFEQACEAWSRHILVGTESPDSLAASSVEDLGALPDAEPDSATSATAIPLAERDWNGLYHFLQHQRLMEEQAVANTTSTLRDLVLDSLDTFGEVLDDDQDFTREIEHMLGRLRQAAENQPIEAMRTEILQTAQLISELIKTKGQGNNTQLEDMRTLIQSSRQEILDMRRELEQDPLTGVHDRGTLEKALEKLGKYATFVREDLAVLLIDVDHLKQINDLKGQAAGDAILRGVGRALIKAFPSKDDFVARFGGDEFAIILSQTDVETAMRLANRCVDLFHRLDIPWEGESLSCSVSIGVAEYNHEEGITACLSRADAALYQAKSNGRDCCAHA
jgi:diguanylate cyclase (GGDEF)-like protein